MLPAQSTERWLFSLALSHYIAPSLIFSHALSHSFTLSFSHKQAEASSQEMHISHNTFLKWKQIPLQSFSRFLSLPLSLPHSFNWKHFSVSPLVLHPALLRRHFNLAHQLGSFLPLTRVSFAFCHRWMITTTRDSCFVGCVITAISSIWHRPRRALDGNLLRPYKIPQYGHLYF